MRDLIGVALALFLAFLGVFFLYGYFAPQSTKTQVQETFLELRQLHDELAAQQAVAGTYGSGTIAAATIIASQALPNVAIATGSLINQWRGSIVVTANDTSYTADYDGVDQAGCNKLITTFPPSSGYSGIAVAANLASVSSATVYAIPVTRDQAASLCTSPATVRFVGQ